MDKNDTPTLLVPLLALLALAFPFAMTSRSPGSAGHEKPQAHQSSAQQQKKKNPLAPHTAARLIEDFLQDQQRPSRGSWLDDDLRGNYRLKFIIATLPDPIDSRLPYFFDSFLDSIQRAFEAGGYVLDRFDLAWPPPGSMPEETTNGSPRYREQPSLLLFRQPATDTDQAQRTLLLVFVVGETPTGGLEKAAMANALQQLSNFYPWGSGYSGLPGKLRSLTKERKRTTQTTVEILGPTFSGSAISLDFALHDWLAKIPAREATRINLRIVSGTATAIDPDDFAPMNHCDPHTFQAVVPPDNETFPAILRYLSSLHYRKAALLMEANTAYGRQDIGPSDKGGHGKGVAEEASGERKSESKSPGKAENAETACHSEKPPDENTAVKVDLLKLPFPLHISQLRTASEKQRLAQLKQQANSGAVSTTTAHIPSAEVSALQPTTIPPSFSNLGVPSEEMVLSSLLSTISHEGYHAVGIMATDERDTIFLAREIHQHCPGTLVFTVNADLLYTHPDVSTSTRGMLVFTPYPLFNLDQIWTPPFRGQENRLQFPSQAAEGVYNATLELLGEEYKLNKKDSVREEGSGQEKKDESKAVGAEENEEHVYSTQPLLDYGRPFPSNAPNATEKPALWVTAMGRNGPLPVALLRWQDPANYGVSDRNASQRTAPKIDKEGVYTATSAFGMVPFALVILIFSWMVIRQYDSPRNVVWPSRLFREPVTPEYQPQARLFLLASLIIPLCLYVVVGSTYFLPAIASYHLGNFFNNTGEWWLFAAILAFVALLLTAGLLALVRAIFVVSRALWKDRPQESLLRTPMTVTILAGCTMVLVLSLALARAWLSSAWGGSSGTVLSKPLEALFTYVRAFAFLSGLSPLVPLFCLALAGFLWTCCSFWRLRMIDGMRLPSGKNREIPCLLRVNTRSFEGVKTLEAKVRKLFEEASALPTRSHIVLIVTLLIAMYFYLFFLPYVPSYEGTRFYFLFGWGFLLVYAALTTEFARLCLAWRALRRLLQRLALHPMKAAYERYQKNFTGLPRIDLAGRLQTITVLSHSVDQAERLVRLASSQISSKALPVTAETSSPDASSTSPATAGASSPDASSASPATAAQDLTLWIPQAQEAVRSAAANLSDALKEDANRNWRSAIEKRSQCQDDLGKLAQLTAEILEPSWRTQEESPLQSKETPDFQAFRELGEEFLAGRTVLLISYFLPTMRNIGALVLSGLLLMLFAVMFYPFLQRNHFLVFNWIVILGFVGLALLVMLQMERDAVLSALNGTAPGKVTVTGHFTFRILTYVMIPILALLGAQFPDTVGQILSWFSSTPGH